MQHGRPSAHNAMQITVSSSATVWRSTVCMQVKHTPCHLLNDMKRPTLND